MRFYSRPVLSIVVVIVGMTSFATRGVSALDQHVEPSLITAIPSRNAIDLDGEWATIVDPYENGYYSYRLTERTDGYFRDQKPTSPGDLVEYDFDTSDRLHVPGDWNSQDERLFLYEGTVWYRRYVDVETRPEQRYVLDFGAVNYEAVVYLNGERIGSHTGGFTPFQFEVTDHLISGHNTLVVKVDNRRKREGVPTVNTDWWNYGGITRSVRLLKLPPTFIQDFVVQLDPENPNYISGHVQLSGPENSTDVTITIQGREHRQTTGSDGRADLRFEAGDLPRWTPDRPTLVDVVVSTSSDRVQDRIGFRTIETQGKEILLNKQPVYLRGISLHEVAPLREGRATTEEDARILLGWAKDLGCNFVRLAHYPHNEFMARIADEMGLMLWSEIPVYWTILWDNPETFANAKTQLTEMILRDRNRASVIIWSVANETPRGTSRLDFLRRLTMQARLLDPTRLISAATELTIRDRRISVDDRLATYLDVLGVNEYLGWYTGSPEDIKTYSLETAFDKPLVISEFGAGAKYGVRGGQDERWTEDYQAAVYREQIRMLDTNASIRGMTPWILTDFRSPRRPLPRIQDFWNRKGLISEHGERKLAFDVLRRFYLKKAGENVR